MPSLGEVHIDIVDQQRIRTSASRDGHVGLVKHQAVAATARHQNVGTKATIEGHDTACGGIADARQRRAGSQAGDKFAVSGESDATHRDLGGGRGCALRHDDQGRVSRQVGELGQVGNETHAAHQHGAAPCFAIDDVIARTAHDGFKVEQGVCAALSIAGTAAGHAALCFLAEVDHH